MFLAYARLLRLPNVFTVFANVIAAYGIALSYRVGAFSLIEFCALALVSVSLYFFGLVINDISDRGEDSRRQLARPLVTGEISVKNAKYFAVVLLLVTCLAALRLPLISQCFALSLFFSIVIYNATPRQSFVGCGWMGLCRAFNWMLALSLAPGALADIWPLSLAVGLYIAGLTFLSRDERELSKPWVVAVSAGFILSAFVLAAVWPMENVGPILKSISVLMLAVAGVTLIMNFWQLRQNYQSENVEWLMRRLILGIIPFDAVLALSAGLPGVALCVACLWFPGRWLAKRIYVT